MANEIKNENTGGGEKMSKNNSQCQCRNKTLSNYFPSSCKGYVALPEWSRPDLWQKRSN